MSPHATTTTTAKDFYSTSPSELPVIIHVSFASHPTAALGAKLVPCDKPAHMFVPGYAVVTKVFANTTATTTTTNDNESRHHHHHHNNNMAQSAGVQAGDILVAVNGKGFRRFAPDYQESQIVVQLHPNNNNNNDDNKQKMDLDHRVVHVDNVALAANDDDDDDDNQDGEEFWSAKKIYDTLLDEIKLRKAESSAEHPLTLTFERYTWDARPHAWSRFLAARDGDIPAAMTLWQNHQQWKLDTFPISLVKPGLQRILRHKAISEIHVQNAESLHPTTVYVNYGVLVRMLKANEITAEDIVLAFVLFNERMLAAKHNTTTTTTKEGQPATLAADPRHAQTCQFIDLRDVTYTAGFRSDVLRIIYNVLEPNYPETLYKMVMYPVSTMFGTTVRTMLGFIHAKTRQKFVITGDMEKACEALGWNPADVQEAGGMTEFMHAHEKLGTSLMFA